LIEVRLKPEVGREHVRHFADQVTRAVLDAGAGAHCVTYSSDGTETIIALVNPGQTQIAIADLKKRLELPEAAIRIAELGRGGIPTIAPIRIALTGPDPTSLREWADAVTTRLAADGAAEGLEAFPRAEQARLSFQIDPTQAAKFDLSTSDLAEATFLASGGAVKVSLPQQEKLEICMEPRPAGADGRLALSVRGSNGQLVPLAAVTQIVNARAPSALCRIGAERAIRLTAYPPAGTDPSLAIVKWMTLASKEREKLRLPPGYAVLDLTNQPAK
jgi:multidrug efflux pump subunit AcrB